MRIPIEPIPGDCELGAGWLDMAWVSPQYSKAKVDRAGETLNNPTASTELVENALQITNNWRSSHGFLLNRINIALRLKNATVRTQPDAVVAQRIKRLSSIRQKLERLPAMKLSRMRDV